MHFSQTAANPPRDNFPAQHAAPDQAQATIKFLRPRAVWLARGKGKSAHYADVAAGVFTKPVPLGAGRAVGWPDFEVAVLQAARVAGKSDAEVRALVAALHAKRATLADQYARAAGIVFEVEPA